MCILLDCELEGKFWKVVGVTLVEHPFVVHRDFGIVTEKVGYALQGGSEGGETSSHTDLIRLSYDFLKIVPGSRRMTYGG